jgi:hypothetical protein
MIFNNSLAVEAGCEEMRGGTSMCAPRRRDGNQPVNIESKKW